MKPSRSPDLVSVGGNLGSGKSTIARVICARLGMSYTSHESAALPTYLDDLWTGPERWAFEVQVSLLASKTAAVLAALESGSDVVVDRSVYEDRDIFARLFHESGYMDDRAIATYRQIAAQLIRPVPTPAFLIFCACRFEECRRRIESRGQRAFELLFPPDHLRRLDALYADWLGAFRECPVYMFETDRVDPRSPDVQNALCDDVRALRSRSEPAAVTADVRLKVLSRRRPTELHR